MISERFSKFRSREIRFSQCRLDFYRKKEYITSMSELKPLPIGIQTFRSIIEGDFVYIDKTQYLYNLIKSQQGVYFLSRPRRFGKSLLLSTLKEIFEGNKELFKGLWLYKSDYNWKPYQRIFRPLRFKYNDEKRNYCIR